MTPCRLDLRISNTQCDDPATIFLKLENSKAFAIFAFCSICWGYVKKHAKEVAFGPDTVIISEDEYIIIMEMRS